MGDGNIRLKHVRAHTHMRAHQKQYNNRIPIQLKENSRALAREFGATLVSLDKRFASASTKREPAFWAPDGVHPSEAGNTLIAQAWLQAVGVRVR